MLAGTGHPFAALKPQHSSACGCCVRIFVSFCFVFNTGTFFPTQLCGPRPWCAKCSGQTHRSPGGKSETTEQPARKRSFGPGVRVGTSNSRLSANTNRLFRDAHASSGCGIYCPCPVSGPSVALGPLPPCTLLVWKGPVPQTRGWCQAVFQSTLMDGKHLLETAGLFPEADSQRMRNGTY